MKKKIVTYLLVASMAAMVAGCCNVPEEASTEASSEEVEAFAEQSTEKVDTESIVDQQKKPEVNEDLLGAIEQLAIAYDEFYSEDMTDSSMWQPFFIDHFIRGNWDGYEYMKHIEKDNGGIITKEQVEYIQRSLTGIDISFDSMKENETIDVTNFVNSTNNIYGNITSYEVVEDEILDADTTYLNAQFESGSASSDFVKKYDMYVFLKENPESCFGGYSIDSLIKVEASGYEYSDVQDQETTGTEHTFYGWYSDEYLDAQWIWPRVDRSADALEYDGIVTVAINEEQRAFVAAHSYEEFKITYVFNEDIDEQTRELNAVKIEVASDEEVTRGLTDLGPDPLKNLAADDILEKFRATRPVRYPGSIYDEGYVLGRWVMKTIGKDNISEELREKGRHIGAANEFWFGTDIANNFSNNIPVMYGTYYALKDYYTSGGMSNTEFYQEMIKACWQENPDKDATILNLYDSLRDVISDFNNQIRETGAR